MLDRKGKKMLTFVPSVKADGKSMPGDDLRRQVRKESRNMAYQGHLHDRRMPLMLDSRYFHRMSQCYANVLMEQEHSSSDSNG